MYPPRYAYQQVAGDKTARQGTDTDQQTKYRFGGRQQGQLAEHNNLEQTQARRDHGIGRDEHNPIQARRHQNGDQKKPGSSHPAIDEAKQCGPCPLSRRPNGQLQSGHPPA